MSMRVELKIDGPKDERGSYRPSIFSTSVDVVVLPQAAIQTIMLEAAAKIVAAELAAVEAKAAPPAVMATQAIR